MPKRRDGYGCSLRCRRRDLDGAYVADTFVLGWRHRYIAHSCTGNRRAWEHCRHLCGDDRNVDSRA